jgi:hypothetical protein
VSPTDVNNCPALHAVQALRDWYVQNGMLPNPNKSEAIVIGTPAQLAKFQHPLSVNLAGANIVCKNSLVSLGVTIDSALSCDRRVDNIISACNYHLRALRYIRPTLDNDTAITVGRAIVLSRIDYCNSLLAGITEANLDRLQRLQNRLIRAIMRLPYRSRVSESRIKLHWLPIRERIRYKVALLAHKSLAVGKPQYLAELLTFRTTSRVLRSSADCRRLVEPRTRNKRATRAFRSAAPLVWNSLPLSLRECQNLDKFKTDLKTLLFK